MPVKQRTPKSKQHRITPAAVAAYKAGAWMDLHRALGLYPWDVSPLDAVDAEPPAWAPPNDAWRIGWPQARALRAELERALAAEGGSGK
jgi:hypothetical protein